MNIHALKFIGWYIFYLVGTTYALRIMLTGPETLEEIYDPSVIFSSKTYITAAWISSPGWLMVGFWLSFEIFFSFKEKQTHWFMHVAWFLLNCVIFLGVLAILIFHLEFARQYDWHFALLWPIIASLFSFGLMVRMAIWE